MVPPHGLQKLKVAPYQFLRVRFTWIILPVNGMCTKCVPTFRGGAWTTPPSYDVYIQPLPEFRI